DAPAGDAAASRASTHGGFDDDPATVQALVARILGRKTAPAEMGLPRSESGLRDQREAFRAAIRRPPPPAVKTHVGAAIAAITVPKDRGIPVRGYSRSYKGRSGCWNHASFKRFSRCAAWGAT